MFQGQGGPMEGGGGMGGMEEIMQMLMQILQSPPDEPAGEVPRRLPNTGVPSQIANSDPLAQVMDLLRNQAQQQQQMGSSTQMMAGSQGGQGAMYGAMGGRPPGS